MQALQQAQMVYGVSAGPLVPGGSPVTATVICPAGTVLVTGGYEVLYADPGDAPAFAGLYASDNRPSSRTTWTVTLVPPPDTGQQLSGTTQVVATALCAPTS